jgi:tRNA(Met) cytidine acetyltransferase
VRHRRLVALRGAPGDTHAAAERLVRDAGDVLWVAAGDRVERYLGRAFDAVVLDLHERLDADALGACEGLVWGGGALVLRTSAEAPRDASLALHPFAAGDVATRAFRRFERIVERYVERHPVPLARADRAAVGTPEQAELVERLARTLASSAPSLTAVLADRGRGKSSALGLALARLEGARIAVSGPSPDAAAEVLRFAPHAPFVPALELARSARELDVIAIDEAARLSVPLLQAIAARHPRARFAFATTCHGYEGTGRGFVLRFLEWASAPRILALREPIRWPEADPLERFAREALGGQDLSSNPATSRASYRQPRDLSHVALDRDALAADEALLREVFGLLVHAHYRTRPSDLVRLLDAPNLAVHASFAGRRVVAATLVAREGALPPDLCRDMLSGARRVRGHALADTLVTHSARPEAGALSMIRSVRIAVDPTARRSGIGRALVDHVHRSYEPDLFGTLFGATTDLVRFRRDVGYELVRLGVSRGARSGEPAAVMLRPVSERARTLVRELREELAQGLDDQLALLAADELPLDAGLELELRRGLPAARPLDPAAARAIVERYAASAQPSDAIAHALRTFVLANEHHLASLDPRDAALLRARTLDRAPWRAAGLGTAAAAMRAMRPAVRALLEISS